MNKLFTSLPAIALLLSANAFAAELVNVPRATDIAVSGFDTVAFFTEAKAVNGTPFITAEHEGTTYFFATEENKATFEQSPEKYIPQFGGYCAYGVSIGKLLPVDISTWQVRDGKLYFNLNPDIRTKFDAAFEDNVSKARGNWPGLVEKHSH